MKNNELNTQSNSRAEVEAFFADTNGLGGELYRIYHIARGLDELLKKYETAQSTVLVMDDYDGGYIDAIKMIVRDLKKLKKPLDKSEKSGILEV